MDTVKNFFCRDVQEVKKKCRRDKKSSDLFCLLLSTGLEPMTLALSEPRATNCARRANSQVMELYQVCSMSGNFFFSPNVGLEPTTTRLRVLRSADWANRAFTCYITRCVINISCYHCTADCRKRVDPEFSPSHIFPFLLEVFVPGTSRAVQTHFVPSPGRLLVQREMEKEKTPGRHVSCNPV